jgi:hypothetical protein
VPIKRLIPTYKFLGFLRLWRDDMAEIVALTQKLDGVRTTLEADDCELTDVEVDLPRLGKRLRYFTLKAVTSARGDAHTSSEVLVPAEEVLTIHLAKLGCGLEASNPNTQTKGVISDIEELAKRCRRIPLWFPRLTAPQPFGKNSSGPSGARKGAAEVTWGFLLTLSFVSILVAALGPFLYYSPAHGHGHILLSAGIAIAIGIPAALLFGFIIFSISKSATIIYTGTRADAPTFWQRNGTNIIIAVVIAAVFYVLGLLTQHG